MMIMKGIRCQGNRKTDGTSASGGALGTTTKRQTGISATSNYKAIVKGQITLSKFRTEK